MRALLVTLSLWLCALPAWGQSVHDLERAKATFKAGAAAYAAGDYTAAIEAFESAYEITPLPAIAFSLAQAERRQYFALRTPEHLERAIALFRRYVEQVASGGRRGDALDALSQLEPLAAQLGLSVGGAPRSEAPRRTRLMIACESEDARVSIDGAPFESAPLIREVTPERHTVRVEAPGYFPAEREVVAVQGELILAEIALRERPATLLLETPEDAEIYVDGRFARHGGKRATLELPSGTHVIGVAEAGHLSMARTVTLGRGDGDRARFELSPTAQRKAARGLFAVSGATLASGIVLGGLSLRAQSRAERFLDARQRENRSPEDLAEYGEQRRSRNQLRGAAIGSIALSVTALVTALLLRQLDKPDTRTLERTPELASEPELASTPTNM